MSNHC